MKRFKLYDGHVYVSVAALAGDIPAFPFYHLIVKRRTMENIQSSSLRYPFVEDLVAPKETTV